MGGPLGQALILIINSLGGLYILAVLLRFLLQAVRADFYNPVSQVIIKATAIPLAPLRRIIPGFRGFDVASLILALLLSSLATALMILASGNSLLPISTIVSWSFVGLLSFILNLYFYALIISIIASFVAPFSGNPVLLIVHQILEPIYSRVRRIIPPMGGLDLSPIFIFLTIRVIEMLVIFPLAQNLRLSAPLVIGI